MLQKIHRYSFLHLTPKATVAKQSGSLCLLAYFFGGGGGGGAGFCDVAGLFTPSFTLAVLGPLGGGGLDAFFCHN